MILIKTAKIFINGQSQAVRLPREYRFSGAEVGIKKVGGIVILYSIDSIWEEFIKCPPATDDFAEAVLTARKYDFPQERESL